MLAGETDRGDAAVAGQILGTYLRAVGVELKVKEQQDLIERLEQLEEALQRQNDRGGGRGIA